MTAPGPWGHGLLIVAQGDRRVGHSLVGYINGVDVTDLLLSACEAMEAELLRLHRRLDPGRVWWFLPGAVPNEQGVTL